MSFGVTQADENGFFTNVCAVSCSLATKENQKKGKNRNKKKKEMLTSELKKKRVKSV